MLCRSSWPNEQLLCCAGRGCLGLATAAKCDGHVESHLVKYPFFCILLLGLTLSSKTLTELCLLLYSSRVSFWRCHCKLLMETAFLSTNFCSTFLLWAVSCIWLKSLSRTYLSPFSLTMMIYDTLFSNKYVLSFINYEMIDVSSNLAIKILSLADFLGSFIV